MLQSLFIQNYALIENLEINFQQPFTVITGETGTGKSLIIGALSLLLGNKADTSLITNKEKKCIIEGVFLLNHNKFKNIFDKNNLDYEELTIIRREILSSGKSRIFINDTPTTLSCVKSIGLLLIDVHSQHQNLLLMDKSFQLNTIDNMAQNVALRGSYDKQYISYINKCKEIEKLEKNYNDFQHLDYYKHQLSELNAAKLKTGEQEKLEYKQKHLANAEEIKSHIYQSLHILNSNESSNTITSINEVCKLLSSYSEFIPELEDLVQRLGNTKIELDDICMELEKINENTTYNKTLLDQISDRLSMMYKLQLKHKVDSTESLLQLKDSWTEKLKNFQSYKLKINSLKSEIINLEKKLKILASKLSNSRKKSFPLIEKRVKSLLNQLGIPHALFKILHHENRELTKTGQDNIQFYFTANKNTSPRPIEKVASGGEISRLMMCLKYINSNASNILTIVFDEIDSGLSGKIAQKMGEIMKKISTNQQIICITHLPQIASMALEHFNVYKSEKKNKTIIQMKNLIKSDRINEIAKMLSGVKVTSSALQNAKELLKNN